MKAIVADVMAELGLSVPESMAGIAREPVPSEVVERLPPAQRDMDGLARRLRRWGAPELAVQLLTEGGLEQTESVCASNRLVEAARAGAVWCCLAGPVGAGKTTAAALWLSKVPGRGGARALIASERIARLPANTVHTETRLEALVDAAALVIDDVGRRDQAQGQGQQGIELAPFVQGVLCERYDARKPTLLTANLDERRLVQILGDDRMRSRWGEVGAYAAVRQVVRPNRRGRA
ncbi:hypothetical protein [Haliangium sp.]|uniref:hypothetical protein n=1 Tax=Haliangium sp. TaxID=2663208 RepID=UPI003D0A1A8A